MRDLKQILRDCAVAVVRTFGSQIVDHETGEPLGRVLFIPWRGKLHVIGLNAAVRVSFLPQPRLTYWKQEIGFSTHPEPDYPNLRRAAAKASELAPR
jgi:hypothetical protein